MTDARTHGGDGSAADARPGLRELGLRLGTTPPGPLGAITDVPAVGVGHVAVRRDEPPPPVGRGVARTCVTAIAPGPPGGLFAAPVAAGAAVLNGAGEMTGFLQVSEWGVLETPIYLSATMAVGRVYDGAVTAATVEATEEAVLSALWSARDVTGRDGRTVRALPHDDVLELLAAHHRLGP